MCGTGSDGGDGIGTRQETTNGNGRQTGVGEHTGENSGSGTEQPGEQYAAGKHATGVAGHEEGTPIFAPGSGGTHAVWHRALAGAGTAGNGSVLDGAFHSLDGPEGMERRGRDGRPCDR